MREFHRHRADAVQTQFKSAEACRLADARKLRGDEVRNGLIGCAAQFLGVRRALAPQRCQCFRSDDKICAGYGWHGLHNE